HYVLVHTIVKLLVYSNMKMHCRLLMDSCVTDTFFFFLYFACSVFPKGGLEYCIPFHSDPKHMIFQYLMEILSFLVPFSIILFSSLYIFRKLRNTVFENKSKQIILPVVVAFSVFWMPYHIVNLIQVSVALAGEKSMKNPLLGAAETAETARPHVTAFAFFSSSVNPVLYAFIGRSYIRSDGINFIAIMLVQTNSELQGSKSFNQPSGERLKGSHGLQKCSRDTNT
ncbi:UNVERIFIED_CONTAM: hypothetical protein FKN15_077879, partial [Acipenser sinensis]